MTTTERIETLKAASEKLHEAAALIEAVMPTAEQAQRIYWEMIPSASQQLEQVRNRVALCIRRLTLIPS